MYLFTYSDLVTKLGNDCDITDEQFISQTELLGYINEAIADAEAAIHNLNYEDKYFLKNAPIAFVNGTAIYSLPSDIYATKIRQLFYNDGGAFKYEIMRIKNLRDINYIQVGDYYQYLITNPTPGVVPIYTIYPTPTVTASYGKLWYIREMQRMDTTAASTNVCEIYECQNFVFAHVRNSVAIKTRRADLIAITQPAALAQYNLMLENLQQMVEDENNLVQMDLSHYNQGCDPYWGR